MVGYDPDSFWYIHKQSVGRLTPLLIKIFTDIELGCPATSGPQHLTSLLLFPREAELLPAMGTTKPRTWPAAARGAAGRRHFAAAGRVPRGRWAAPGRAGGRGGAPRKTARRGGESRPAAGGTGVRCLAPPQRLPEPPPNQRPPPRGAGGAEAAPPRRPQRPLRARRHPAAGLPPAALIGRGRRPMGAPPPHGRRGRGLPRRARSAWGRPCGRRVVASRCPV